MSEVENIAPMSEERSVAVALPHSVQDLINARKSKTKQNLNDQVEQIHLSLWENDKYKSFLDATYAEQAVEGDLMADDYEAARMIREYAAANGNPYVERQKLATLRKCMGVVLRRYGITRKERREA